MRTNSMLNLFLTLPYEYMLGYLYGVAKYMLGYLYGVAMKQPKELLSYL